MFKFKYIIFSVILFLTLFSMGCKPTLSLTQKNNLKATPEFFGDNRDTTSIADINWKTYFSDPALVALIDEALQNNLDVLATFARMDITNANIRAAQGALLPTVGGGGTTSLRRFGDYTMDGAGNATTEIKEGKIVPVHLPDFFVGLQSSWEIDAWGKLKNQKKAAMMRYLLSAEGRNLVITNLIADIALNYYALLALDNQIDIIRETIVLQENALEIVKAQKEAGRETELAVKQFEAQIFNLKTNEVELQQTIVEYESQINTLLSRYPQAVNRNKATLLQAVPTRLQTGIPAQLLRNRPDIRQAEYEIAASKADVEAAKAAFKPTINIVGLLGLQAFNPVVLVNPKSVAYNLIGGIVAPIFNKKAIEAAYINANAVQQEAFYNYQKGIINGYIEVDKELLSLKNIEQMHNLKNQETDRLNKAIETATDLFKLGRANYLEVLTTQQSALNAKLELTMIKQRQYNSLVKIYKALGGGWR